jgi:hypothetical protein
MADFDSNFDKLKQAGVIPDVPEEMLPRNVHTAIGDLTQPEIDVLVNIAQKTGSYIFLHKDHSIICGY